MDTKAYTCANSKQFYTSVKQATYKQEIKFNYNLQKSKQINKIQVDVVLRVYMERKPHGTRDDIRYIPKVWLLIHNLHPRYMASLGCGSHAKPTIGLS